MSFYHGPTIVTNGLTLSLDAADRNSYPGTGTSWFDMSGNGYTATLTNGPTYSTNNGGNIVFDGTNDYVLTNFSAYSPSTKPLTYQIVFKNNINSDYKGLIGKSNFQVSGISIGIMFNDRVMPSVNASGQNFENQVSYDNTIISMGTFMFNGRNILVYRNKTLLYSTTIGFDIVANANPIEIGGSIQGGWTYANMNVYSVLIYDKQLTESEISQNFDSLKSRFGL